MHERGTWGRSEWRDCEGGVVKSCVWPSEAKVGGSTVAVSSWESVWYLYTIAKGSP